MKNKHKNFLFFWLLTTTGILLTLYVEYKFQYFQLKWLGLRVLIISAAVVQYGILSTRFKKKASPFVFALLALFVILYLLNFLANSINVYHLDRFQKINNFCEYNNEVCEIISTNFYKFKVYRFVSLTPYFFFYMIFLLTGLLFSEKISKQTGRIWKQTDRIWKKIPKLKLKYAWIFYFLMTYLIFHQLVAAFSIISKKTVKMFYTFSVPFEERWEPVMGGRFSFGWMKTYGDFINSQATKNSTILIPNQTAPWEMEGNPFYIRWFFYPRRTVHMENQGEIPENADYVLISYGVFGYNKVVFPDFSIKKDEIEEIILVNRETLETTSFINEDFIPENFIDKWGIIKLK